MIQLCAIKVAPRHWEITTTDMLTKYKANWSDTEIKLAQDDEEIKNWLEDVRGEDL